MRSTIEIQNVSKRFHPFGRSSGANAVDDVSLTVRPGELVALLGPSGSGKTTLLRMVAGLEHADSGTIRLVAEAGATELSGRVGFVFQHYALFRHLSVFENVAFGLRVRPRKVRPSDREIQQRVDSLLDLVQLDGLADRLPSQLSGGQRQRVALARALCVEPSVLLLDEPFGALDARVRRDLRAWLRALHDRLRMTTVLVTHDQEEALEVADRVVVMHRGRVEQDATPLEVFDHPATPFVAEFIGDVNVLEGPRAGERTWVRPHELDISHTPTTGAVPGTLTSLHTAGAFARLHVAVESGHGRPVQAVLARDRLDALRLEPGMAVWLVPRRLRTFAGDDAPPETGLGAGI